MPRCGVAKGSRDGRFIVPRRKVRKDKKCLEPPPPLVIRRCPTKQKRGKNECEVSDSTHPQRVKKRRLLFFIRINQSLILRNVAWLTGAARPGWPLRCTGPLRFLRCVTRLASKARLCWPLRCARPLISPPDGLIGCHAPLRWYRMVFQVKL